MSDKLLTLSQDQISVVKGKNIALVMSGFINALGLIRGLAEDSNIIIVCICKKGSSAGHSKYINMKIEFQTEDEILPALVSLNMVCSKIIPFPAFDRYFTLLIEERQILSNFSILWESKKLIEKDFQIELVEKLGLIYPKTISVHDENDYSLIKKLQAPWIIKPSYRMEGVSFKAVITDNIEEVKKLCRLCFKYNINAIIAEYIEGDDSSLYTYGGYAFHGNVENPYTGKKVSQKPYLRGQASISETTEERKIIDIGNIILAELKFTGIFQIEFKRSETNNKFYFIELNARNWLWSQIANKQGINLPISKYYSELNNKQYVSPFENKNITQQYYFIFFEAFIYNILVERRGSVAIKLIKLILSKKRMSPALFSIKDPMPLVKYTSNILSRIFFRKRTGR